MSCNFTEKISSLIDGELTQVEAREVERHLLSCGECEQLRADFLNLRSEIAAFETSLQPAVQNRALKKILSTERRVPVRGLQWSFATQAIAFVALLIAGAVLSLMLFPSSDKSPKSTARADLHPAAPLPSASVQPKATPEESPKPAPKEVNNPRSAPSPAKRPPVREPKPGEQFAAIPETVRPADARPADARPADARPADAQTMTAMHFDKAETLLVGFRNVRLNEPGTAEEIAYERKRAQQLVYQNMILRREAEASGDIQTESLLESLEPILLDIANLADKPNKDAVRVIRERVERKNIVPLLRVNSTALARALD
ncbi:MAG TPA: zf-HC2 domain-containing protein [Pyrinomonadaceae bacterium]|nr:zf-HC2 domain-containing protein [Pyrinomonadaceae bacterium]